MKKYILLNLMVLSTLSSALANPRYDSVSGKCRDADGNNVHLRKTTEAELLKTQNAECADLRGIRLLNVMNGENWNFKGSSLNGSYLSFAYFRESDFRGANLAGIEGGYITLRGVVDRFTKVPTDKAWNCISTSSLRIDCSK